MVQATRTELSVNPRAVLGKKVKKMRREGLTPANIFGHNVESKAIQVSTDELKHVLRSAGRNDIVYLRLDGEEPRPTFVRDVQQNPVSDAILHVDFMQISLQNKVRLEVAIHLVGLSPAVDTLGGILVHGLDHVTVEALPTEVPSVIEVDVTGLVAIDQALHVSDLSVPNGVTILTDMEQVVALVSPPAVEVVVEEEEEVTEEEAAAAEEGAAEAGAAEETKE
jgi:large subunit ribosomal protein L25